MPAGNGDGCAKGMKRVTELETANNMPCCDGRCWRLRAAAANTHRGQAAQQAGLSLPPRTCSHTARSGRCLHLSSSPTSFSRERPLAPTPQSSEITTGVSLACLLAPVSLSSKTTIKDMMVEVMTVMILTWLSCAKYLLYKVLR